MSQLGCERFLGGSWKWGVGVEATGGYFQQGQLFEKQISRTGGCVIVLVGAPSLEDEGRGPAGGALQLSGSPCVPGAEEGFWSGGATRNCWGDS